MSAYRDQLANVPDVLIVSGLDPSGGAGFLADARVVQMLGGRPCGAITAQTVQNTEGLRSIHEVDADVLDAQLNALLIDVEIKAIKLGMLGSVGIVKILDQAFAMTNAPVVWDPIAGPTHGSAEVSNEALAEALRLLGPHLTVITPNSLELGLLTGSQIHTLNEAVINARAFAAVSKVAVLVKGGHLGGEESVDVLVHDGHVEYLRSPRIVGASVHGTGCALSSAIATLLAMGRPLVDACREAKTFVSTRIAAPVSPGRGAPAIV